MSLVFLHRSPKHLSCSPVWPPQTTHLIPESRSSSPSLPPSLSNFSGFTNSLQWFSPFLQSWQTQIKQSRQVPCVWTWFLLLLLRLRPLMPSLIEFKSMPSPLLPPLSWIPPWTPNKSRGGCRPQADLLTFSEVSSSTCSRAGCRVARAASEPTVQHRRARMNQSFVWLTTAAGLLLLSLAACFSGVARSWHWRFKPSQRVFVALSIVGKNVRMCTKTTRKKDLYGLKYIRWVNCWDNWFSQAPFKAWTHNLLP